MRKALGLALVCVASLRASAGVAIGDQAFEIENGRVYRSNLQGTERERLFGRWQRPFVLIDSVGLGDIVEVHAFRGYLVLLDSRGYISLVDVASEPLRIGLLGWNARALAVVGDELIALTHPLHANDGSGVLWRYSEDAGRHRPGVTTVFIAANATPVVIGVPSAREPYFEKTSFSSVSGFTQSATGSVLVIFDDGRRIELADLLR